MSNSIKTPINQSAISETKLSVDNLKVVNAAYAKLKAIKHQQTEPIAIVGMSCRFPKANDLDSFWHNLLHNVDAISKISKERYNIDAYYYNQPGIEDKISSPYGGCIENVYDFDAGFFDISPKEAIALDPQQRVLLEVAVEALENANQPIDSRLSQMNSSVYIGISSFDYSVRLQQHEDIIDSYLGTGTLLSPAAGRISYSLNLRGPSMVIDTACSSSLVSVHQAVASLRSRESDISLVGGVGLILEPNLSICFSKAKMLSPDGKCKTFDADANGYVRGEGCAVVILKRLSDAIANQDNVLAIICGSAVNQDGASGGLTIPSGPSQENVIKRALQSANIMPQAVDYIEAHGTGTSLGDPIEVNALGGVFADRHSNLKIGSVKTNIGHLEASSGLASLIKVVLAMQNEFIPASLHFKKPNPNIAWQDLPIEVISQNTPWPKGDRKRIAGISAFGFSGTNAHIIVAESPIFANELQVKTQDKSVNFSLTNAYNLYSGYVLTISAKNKVSLLGYIKKLQRFLQYQCKHVDLENFNDKGVSNNCIIGDVCFTSNVGRTHYKERLALVVQNASELKEKITGYISYVESNKLIHSNNSEFKTNLKNSSLPNDIYISDVHEQDSKITFIFQGIDDIDKYNYMFIYHHFQHQPYFQEIINKCQHLVTQHGWINEQRWNAMLSASVSSIDETDKSCTKLVEINLLTFCVQYALAKFLYYIGIKHKIVAGYGIGEYVAACIAGIFTLDDSLFLVRNAILLAHQKSNDEGYKDAISEFKRLIQKITIKKSLKTQFFGILSSKYTPDNMDYWCMHFEHQIKTDFRSHMFDDVKSLVNNIGDNAYYGCCLVIGSSDFNHNNTENRGSGLFPNKKIFEMSIPVVGHRFNNFDLSDVILDNLGAQQGSKNFLPHIAAYLYSRGINLLWDRYHQNTSNHKVCLPTYSWNRENYMFNTKKNAQNVYNDEFDTKYSIVQKIVKLPTNNDKTIVFCSYIKLDNLPYLKDHRIFDKVVFPESTFLEMLLEASDVICKNFVDHYNFVIQDMTLHQSYIFVNGQDFVNMQVIFTQVSEISYNVEIVSLNNLITKNIALRDSVGKTIKYQSHISGTVNFIKKNSELQIEQQTLDELLKKFGISSDLEFNVTKPEGSRIDIESYYQEFAKTGVDYGKSFKSIRQAVVSASGHQVLGLIEPTSSDSTIEGNFCINPVVIDGCLQLISAVHESIDNDSTYFIMSVKSIEYYLPMKNKVWCHVLRLSNLQSDKFPVFNLELFNENGTLLAKINGLQINRAGKDVFLSTQTRNWFYKIVWQKAFNVHNNNNVIETLVANSKMMKSHGIWLIMSNGDELTNKIKSLLNKNKQKYITVSTRDKFREQSEADYIIDSMSADAFEKLFSSLQAKNEISSNVNSDLSIKGVIYSWGENEQLNDTIMDVSLELCLGLLYLAQTINKMIGTRTGKSSSHIIPRLCVITRNAQVVNDEKNKDYYADLSTNDDGSTSYNHGDLNYKNNYVSVRPQQSSLWGMGRVITLENPELKPLFIDYNNITSNLESAVLSDILSTHDENQLVYRDGQRYVARLQHDYSVPRTTSCTIDPKSAYLITGGFGALGMQIATLLVQRGARYLVLVSRNGASSQKAKDLVKYFEDIGVTVQVLALDISRPDIAYDDISKLIKINAPLRGIVHTAGVLDDRLLLQQTRDSFVSVLAPKIQGVWNLHKLTQNMVLDFFVCFSSMTSVIGAIGQINYAAANSFMDILCHYRVAMGLPAISVSWGPWSEVGMGANKELERRWFSMGISSIGLEEGTMVFEQLLGVGSSHLGVMPTDWSKYPSQNNFFSILKQENSQKTQEQDISFSLLSDLRSADPVRRKKMLIKYIESQICKILGYEEGKSFEENQGFFELGMNSLTAVEFKNNLQDTLNCKLSSTITFDYPTIAKLANYLDLEVVQTDSNEINQEKDMNKLTEDVDEIENVDTNTMIEKLSQQLGI